MYKILFTASLVLAVLKIWLPISWLAVFTPVLIAITLWFVFFIILGVAVAYAKGSR